MLSINQVSNQSSRILRFPLERVTSARRLEQPCQIMILPVIRYEWHEDLPVKAKRKRVAK
jgi:hypothetical protein